jgi:predicted O-methyltransferase YrrM
MVSDDRERVNARLLVLHGGDRFGDVVAAAETHREVHGVGCGLYPAGPAVMGLAAAIVRVARARRILDVGTGFGYSALWLAEAAGAGARIDAIDRFEEHVARAREFADAVGLGDRIRFLAGDAVEVLHQLDGPYDLIHDDGWFAGEPVYFERMLALLAPGGTITIPNWLLLEDAITGVPRRDWSEFAGPGWADETVRYAERLARDPRLAVAWIVSPPLAVVVRR